jgi:hypothetical protein
MPERAANGCWIKGTSGNPSGRTKEVGIVRDLAREHTTAAIETLVAICKDNKVSPSARVAAASALLDRGWGKASQAMDVSIEQRTSLVEILTQLNEFYESSIPGAGRLIE